MKRFIISKKSLVALVISTATMAMIFFIFSGTASLKGSLFWNLTLIVYIISYALVKAWTLIIVNHHSPARVLIEAAVLTAFMAFLILISLFFSSIIGLLLSIKIPFACIVIMLIATFNSYLAYVSRQELNH